MAEFFETKPPVLTSNASIPILGRVWTTGRIQGEREGDPVARAFVEVLPSPSSIAYQVLGNSMLPKFDNGDIVIVDRDGQDPATIIGMKAIVQIEGDGLYLRRINEGARPGLYDLESMSAPTMRNQRIEWASKVIAIVPAGTYDIDTHGNDDHDSPPNFAI